MKINKNIFAGFAVAAIACFGIVGNTYAATTIGSTGSGTVTINEEVSSVKCRVLDETETTGTDTSMGMKCEITLKSSGKVETVYYTTAYMNSGHTPAAQQTAIINKLVADGLMTESTAESSTPSGSTSGGSSDFGSVDSDCTSILPDSWCNSENGDGVIEILNLILNIMTMGMGILATIGIVISGVQWLTARDKEDQIVKAKSRIFNIVIGIMVWGIMWLVLQWLLPGGINLEITTT
ncbi:MAG: hypothetical protein ACK5MU_01965 [Candidatus Saccharimonadales bacterium]